MSNDAIRSGAGAVGRYNREVMTRCSIVYALRRQLSLTHLRTLMCIDDPTKRDSCTEIAESEHDLESAILTELQRFIIEIGSDFGFMARQKRMTIDGRDYYLANDDVREA